MPPIVSRWAISWRATVTSISAATRVPGSAATPARSTKSSPKPRPCSGWRLNLRPRTRTISSGMKATPARNSALLLALLLLALCASCAGTRYLADPMLQMRSDQGQELGVATSDGVVFLGRTARSGEIEITAWFGDGASTEVAVVEPLGGGLFTAETEIRLPSVPISFDTPVAGERVSVFGRSGSVAWEEVVKVTSDPRVVEGFLLPWIARFEGHPELTGAGVFVVDEQNPRLKRLVGLVSGRLEITAADGTTRSYLAVVGPSELWRLVTARRDNSKKHKWVYREDIL